MTTATDATVSPSNLQSSRNIAENSVLVWVDGTIDKSEKDWQRNLEHVQGVINELNIFTKPNDCIQFLNSISNDNVFLITAGFFGQGLIHHIHEMPQIHTIYIFCGNEVRHKTWTKSWEKIRGVFTSIEELCSSLKEATHQFDQDSISMSFIPQQQVITTAESGEIKLNQVEASYSCSRLLKELILGRNDDDFKLLPDLINFCLQHKVSKSQLEYFEHEYHQKTPIYWYTADMFLFPMLNKAVRTIDIESITKLGFYIRQLHQQLKQLNHDQTSDDKTPSIVYRAQGLPEKVFNNLLNAKGGILSFNSFLLANSEKNIAVQSIENINNKDKNIVNVIFMITIDPSKVSNSTNLFAFIDKYSAQLQKNQILFNMHTVCHIDDIKQATNNNQLWEVSLSLVDEHDLQLTTLTGRIKEQIKGDGWHQIGNLLVQLNNFNQAEIVYLELLKNASSENDKEQIYHQLGLVKQGQGNYKEAASYHEKTLEIKRKTVSEDDPSLADSYSNIGMAYKSMGNYSKALELYEKACKLKEQSSSLNESDLASYYSNIGFVCANMGEFSKSLEFYSKAHIIYEKILPSNHLDLANSYGNVGQMYSLTGEYSKALEFTNKAHTVYETALPPGHPDLGTSFSSIGQVYENLGDSTKALEFYEKALQIREAALPPDHPDVAASYSCIAGIYKSKANYSKAFELYEKAHKIYQKALSPDHPDLANSYTYIGGLQKSMGNYPESLKLYQKALQIYEKVLPENHPDLATTYISIGQTYCNMCDYMKALEFYNKSLKIRQKALPPNHSDLGVAYNEIGRVYNSLGEHTKAFETLQKAHEIYQISLPPDHPWLAISYSWIGKVYRSMKKYSDALDSFEKCLEIFKKKFPENHPNLATTYSNIGDVYRLMGEFEKALQFHQDALKIQENSKCNPVDRATTYSNLGDTYLEMKDYSMSLTYFKKGLEIYEKKLSKNHLDLAIIYHNLAKLYLSTEEYNMAIKYAQQAVKIAEEKLPANHHHLLAYKETLSKIGAKM